jgi:hypothetical protein
VVSPLIVAELFPAMGNSVNISSQPAQHPVEWPEPITNLSALPAVPFLVRLLRDGTEAAGVSHLPVNPPRLLRLSFGYQYLGTVAQQNSYAP